MIRQHQSSRGPPGRGAVRSARRHGSRPCRWLERCMGILDRILHTGEGRKIEALEGIVPGRQHVAVRDRGSVRRRTRNQDQRVPSAARQRRVPVDDLLVEAFAGHPQHPPGDRPASLRRPAHGRRGAALRLWVAEANRGRPLCRRSQAYLNGVNGKGVHLVTVNDYLARRDAGGWARSTAGSGSRSA